MYYDPVNEYDRARSVLHDCIENALNTSILGVVDAEMTYGGTIGGYFLDANEEAYLYEVDDEGVIFASYNDNIRGDAIKGKKCPGGYWIPRNKECKRSNMSPSAQRGVGGARGNLMKAALAAGLVGAGGLAAKKGVDAYNKQQRDQANQRNIQTAEKAAVVGLAAAGGAAYAAAKRGNAAQPLGSRQEGKKKQEQEPLPSKSPANQAKDRPSNEERIKSNEEQIKAHVERKVGEIRQEEYDKTKEQLLANQRQQFADRERAREEQGKEFVRKYSAPPSELSKEQKESLAAKSGSKQPESSNKNRKRVSQPAQPAQSSAPKPVPQPAPMPAPAAPSGERKSRKRGSSGT